MSTIRQLASSFDNASTYAPLRATLDDFDETRFMPLTIFTLCDTPDQEGYGCNSGSAPKVGSLLLQLVAIHMNTKRRFTAENMSRFYDIFNNTSRKENTEGWTLLDTAAKEINLAFVQHENESIDPYTFITKVQSLTKIANFVGGVLHKANKKAS